MYYLCPLYSAKIDVTEDATGWIHINCKMSIEVI